MVAEPRPDGGFDLSLRTRVVCGRGAIDRIGELVQELGSSRVFLVTDPGIVVAGHVARAEHALTSAGLVVERFAEACENPTSADVRRAADAARAFQPDLFLGLGGGSCMDLAKGANFLVTCGGKMQDYQGRNKATRPLAPMVAVPTTAGTGSEVQSFTLIADETTHQKMACGDPSAAPRVALLDPELTVSQPRHVTACTGLDALGHAVESVVSKARNPVSVCFAREAFRLAVGAFPRVLADRRDMEARGDMLIAATYAGLAIENGMLGAAHSMANPLTAHFQVPHGQAVALALPSVVAYNAELEGPRGTYASMARDARWARSSDDDHQGAQALSLGLRDLYSSASFTAPAVAAERLGDLAREAAGQWTARFNPRSVDEESLEALYRRALDPQG